MQKELTLQEIQHIELDLLKAFHNFCVAHDLRYSLCGGSLLGAVRHKGFIPWDDDIDVFMPRPDYERLRTLASGTESIGERLYLSDFQKNIDLPKYDKRRNLYPFLKLMHTETVVEEKGIPMQECIWIDIFPIDGLSNKRTQSVRLYKRMKKYTALNIVLNSKLRFTGNLVNFLVKCLLTPIACFLGLNHVNAMIEKTATQFLYDDSTFVGTIVWGYGSREIMSKTDVEFQLMEFEGMQFYALKNYDLYLESLYGDYMQLPPEEKRRSHLVNAYWI